MSTASGYRQKGTICLTEPERRAVRWREAFLDAMPDLTRAELHVALAVAQYESGLGAAWVSRRIYDWLRRLDWVADSFEDWSAAVRASNNLGATQYKRPRDFGLQAPFPARSPDGKGFLYIDTSPQDDGSSHPYAMYFSAQVDGDDEQVASHFLGILYTDRPTVREAAARGDLMGVSTALRETRYYEGFGATQQERINNHHRALTGAAVQIARALVWPMPDGSHAPRATIKQGHVGPDVAALQNALGLTPDGIFGPRTAAAVAAFQAAHGLTPDSIVGPMTWTALRGKLADETHTDDDEGVPSAPPSSLLTDLAELPGQERTIAERICRAVVDRLNAGRIEYGPLDLANDTRYGPEEATEELVDGAIYLQMHRLRKELRGT